MEYADRFELEEEMIRRNAACYAEAQSQPADSSSASGGMQQHADSPLKLGPQEQRSGR